MLWSFMLPLNELQLRMRMMNVIGNWLYILIQFKSKLRPDLKLFLLTKYSFLLF